ncbi:MAG: hypothetical protein ACJ8CR_02615 [Roseiflexaceae bacterium]
MTGAPCRPGVGKTCYNLPIPKQAGENNNRHVDKQQRVEHVIDPRRPLCLAEEALGHFGDPLPVQQQVGDDRSAERDTEPLMNGYATEVRRHSHQRAGTLA